METSPDGLRDVAAPQRVGGQSYAVISLFDGCGHAPALVTKTVGYAPSIQIIAEMNANIRMWVAQQYGYASADNVWKRAANDAPTLYLTDVWSILDNQAETLRVMIGALPQDSRILLIGGSPCQDLTRARP